jgi:glycosyltransferase involved in cell wall biosynthesis
MGYPKISVITVVYNARATILLTANSVFSQTYSNLEYIIIDGKSTDGTIEIIKKIQNKLQYWISEKDNGIYDAMNKGIKASKGEWIIFLGADDVFYDEEVLTKIFTGNKLESVDFLYGDVILKSKGKIFGGSRSYDQLIDRNINHQSIFYRKTIFEKIGLFNLKYKILADYEFNLHIFRNPVLVKKYIPGVITLYYDKGRSNQIIDGNFYEDQLEYFLNIDKLSAKDNRLQTYFFFYGFAKFLKNKKIAGLKTIFYSLTIGKRKFYYFMVSIKYFLSLLGFFKKIRTSYLLNNNQEHRSEPG